MFGLIILLPWLLEVQTVLDDRIVTSRVVKVVLYDRFVLFCRRVVMAVVVNLSIFWMFSRRGRMDTVGLRVLQLERVEQLLQFICGGQFGTTLHVIVFDHIANSQLLMLNSIIYKAESNNSRSPWACRLVIISRFQHMEIIQGSINQLRKLKPTKFFEQVFALVIIVGSALALWKTLCVGFNSECPVVVVLTGSMEPGYYRGDILFVTHWDEPIIPGDVVVYNLRTQAIPIVHRVITVQERRDGNLYILTKGDNNNVDDRGLYPSGVKWLHKQEMMGKMRLYLPYMGMFTIWLNDYAWFKYTVLGLMGFFVIIAKDPQ